MNLDLFEKAAALSAMLALAGCFSVKYGEERDYGYESVVGSTTVCEMKIDAVNPKVERDLNGDLQFQLMLQGSFQDVETQKKSSGVKEKRMSIGFFPGVLGCRDGYSGALKNGAAAFWYNIVFVGLPTVYGLVIEPFNPNAQPQSGSVASRDFFIRSPLIGFSKYSERRYSPRTVVVRKPAVPEKRLENVNIAIPELGVESKGATCFSVPASRLGDRESIEVVVRIPPGHKDKHALGDIDGVSVTVPCPR